MVKPVWRLISLLLGLGAFFAVTLTNWLGGEEALWCVGKGIAVFIACWITLGWLGGILAVVVDRNESTLESEVRRNAKSG